MVTTTTAPQTQNETILIINSFEIQKAMTIDLQGNVDEPSNFVFAGQTGAYHSCSIVLRGRMFIIGEEFDYRDQISEVKDCGLWRVGTLPMNFAYGGCNTFTDTEEYALLCFAADKKTGCHRFSGDQVRSLTLAVEKCNFRKQKIWLKIKH